MVSGGTSVDGTLQPCPVPGRGPHSPVTKQDPEKAGRLPGRRRKTRHDAGKGSPSRVDGEELPAPSRCLEMPPRSASP